MTRNCGSRRTPIMIDITNLYASGALQLTNLELKCRDMQMVSYSACRNCPVLLNIDYAGAPAHGNLLSRTP